MMVSRGEIYLANEVGKMRPVLVIQSDLINKNSYPTTIIIPLSSQLIDDTQPLRYRITKREKLKLDSDALIAHIRSIDNDRFVEKIAKLSYKEMQVIKKLVLETIE
jgi:mRNA interferase MazF